VQQQRLVGRVQLPWQLVRCAAVSHVDQQLVRGDKVLQMRADTF
jgi:hypothetical protein